MSSPRQRFAAPLLASAVLTLAAAHVPAVAQAPAAQPVPPDSTIHRIIATRIDSGRAMGIIVGITENGKRRYVRHGAAGAGRAPLNQHTLFEIGSITKTFNALLLADAVQRGEVRLDQPVAELLPAGVTVPARGDTVITLAHLATHRSGLPRLPTNLQPADSRDPYADYDTTRLYAFLRGHTLTRAPGTAAEYSNLGAGLLGHALVLRSGASSWAELVRDRILHPLGMHETFVLIPDSVRSRFSAGHNPAMDTVPAWHVDVLGGAGALRSSAADMLTYLEAQLDPPPTALGRAIEAARAVTYDLSGGTRMALGWVVRGSGTPTTWAHGGGTAGFSTIAIFDTSRSLGVVVLSNAGVPAEDIAVHLMDPSSPLRMPPVPPRRTAITVSADHLERLVGTYPLAPTFSLTVTREGDALYAQPTNQPRFRLWPSAPDRFFVREVDAELSFELGETGPATAVTLHQNGREVRGMRQP